MADEDAMKTWFLRKRGVEIPDQSKRNSERQNTPVYNRARTRGANRYQPHRIPSQVISWVHTYLLGTKMGTHSPTGLRPTSYVMTAMEWDYTSPHTGTLCRAVSSANTGLGGALRDLEKVLPRD